MTKRIKFTQPITRERAEALLGEVATLTLERNSLQTEMDVRITDVRTDYEGRMSELKTGIEEKVALLEAWAGANPDQFPKDRKSLEFVHGKLGYRTGTPKLKTILRKTWDRVLETLKAFPAGELVRSYVRTKEEVNKELIISDYSQGQLDFETLRKIGVEVVQEESFFVEPKLEELENRVTQEAA